MANVFVSYVSEDPAIAEKISRGLGTCGLLGLVGQAYSRKWAITSSFRPCGSVSNLTASRYRLVVRERHDSLNLLMDDLPIRFH